jgi:hypothetical protein
MKTERCIYITLFCLVFSLTSFASEKNVILVEAENFKEKGGWVLDQQFMDQMGSPFLLAHGIGKPVADASTKVSFSSKGIWHVFARTWNWCAPWKVKESPGMFQLLVNGIALENNLGTGSKWDWEYAGSIMIEREDNTLSLHDLTGFEGRCDAIVFSKDFNIKIPNESEAMYAFRKKQLGIPDKPKEGGHYDLIVAGGGIAGLTAAIKASREGLKVALLHNRPVPGGNNSIEVQVVISGRLHQEPYPQLGNIVEEIGSIYRDPSGIEHIIEAEKNLSYICNMHVYDVVVEAEKITAVIARHIESSEETIYYAPLFADCTGDGNLGFYAGAEFRIGREMRQETRETLAPDNPDNLVLGATISWNSQKRPDAASFPVCDWAIQFTDASCEKEFSGSNWWEAGFYYDQVDDAEYIRDYLFRAVYGNWAFMKNKSSVKNEYADRELTYMTYIAGKRESRRLLGDVFFLQQDIEKEYIKYDDAIITCTYTIDQHFPEPRNSFFFTGEEFKSTMKHNFNPMYVSRRYLRDDQVNPPFRIPYRCLYSKNIENLFMAGRNISVSHIALSACRVQGTTGMMGELVGLAASLCKKYECSPREVYSQHLPELLDRIR